MTLVNQILDANGLSPLAIFAAIQQTYPQAALLESAAAHGANRYSFIGIKSYAQIKTSNNQTYKIINGVTTQHQEHPFNTLRTLNKTFPVIEDNMPATHAIGFMAYDAVRLFEEIPDRHMHDDLPDMLFTYYQTSLTYDHVNKKIKLTALCKDEASGQAALNKLSTLLQAAKQFKPLHFDMTKTTSTSYLSDLDDAQYMHMVEQAKAYITKGDAF
ncbi:MAG: hypothetical protein ACK4PR_08225, partial [Gammaproteobacteria bacterium]